MINQGLCFSIGPAQAYALLALLQAESVLLHQLPPPGVFGLEDISMFCDYFAV